MSYEEEITQELSRVLKEYVEEALYGDYPYNAKDFAEYFNNVTRVDHDLSDDMLEDYYNNNVR